MRAAKMGCMAAAVACLGATSTAAWACDVYGSVVCRADTSIGVSGVDVALKWLPDGPLYSTTSGADGTFYVHVAAAGVWYDVNLTGEDVYCSGAPIYLDPIQVDDAVQCPTEPPPPPACVPTMPAGITFPYCPTRPLGNPRAECALFGLEVLDKTDLSGGASVIASATAPLALVKAGGCYDVSLNVVAGETVLAAPFSQGISHVTYCTCPAAP